MWLNDPKGKGTCPENAYLEVATWGTDEGTRGQTARLLLLYYE